MISRIADRVRVALAILGPLGAGSRVLLLRLIERFGWKTVGTAAVLAVYAAARYRTWIIWGIVLWCAAAWMHAPKPAAADAPDTEDEGEPDTPAQAPTDPFPGMIWDLLGNARGIHIKTIVEWLHTSGHDTTCTPADVTAALDRRQIPVRASVRDASGRVNKGVRKADLEAWLEARSPTVRVSLSKGRSNAATTGVTCDVADDATDVATPATVVDE